MSEAVSVEDVRSRQEQRSSPLYQGRVEVYAKADEGGPALGKAPLWFDRTTGAARVSGAELEAFVSGLGAD